MSKPKLVVIVEGQTETNALGRNLSQHLYALHASLIHFTVIGKTGSQKGGYKSFKTFIDQVKMFAKEYPGVYISSYFDYYGFNPAWEMAEIKRVTVMQ